MRPRARVDLRHMFQRLEQGDPLWPAQAAVAVAIALNFGLAKEVLIGPRWLLPGVELVLLAWLVVLAPRRATQHSRTRRRLALTLIALVSLTNVVTLGLLVHFLVNGGKVGGHALILSGSLAWMTNVLLFAVWYWELDRGGPVARFLEPDRLPDFQFPQMENPHLAPEGWRPGFVDYLYTSFTNATAFSPTDTMPLTPIAKTLMGIQSVAALVTVGLVVARAVNILG
ncbi:MAG TPA: hypothetical protein VFF79_06055 [Conexibacter sp.]|jgi:uncharacterized membrane protein|nr:hypothetical protein [Conexibacter sp.]